MQKAYKISHNFKLAIIMESTENKREMERIEAAPSRRIFSGLFGGGGAAGGV